MWEKCLFHFPTDCLNKKLNSYLLCISLVGISVPYESNLISGLDTGGIGNYIGSQGVASIYQYLTGNDGSLFFGTVTGLVMLGVGVAYGPRVIRNVRRIVRR